jgi:glutaredoxin
MILKALREGLGRVVIFVDRVTRPTPLERGADAQRAVDEAAAGLALYQFHACPFCIKTRRAMHRLNVPMELRDAQHDALRRSELETGGGKIQVPCLRIEEPGGPRWLYESKAIIAYLEDRFGAATEPAVESS